MGKFYEESNSDKVVICSTSDTSYVLVQSVEKKKNKSKIYTVVRTR